jgi:hypothetical protein
MTAFWARATSLVAFWTSTVAFMVSNDVASPAATRAFTVRKTSSAPAKFCRASSASRCAKSNW